MEWVDRLRIVKKGKVEVVNDRTEERCFKATLG